MKVKQKTLQPEGGVMTDSVRIENSKDMEALMAIVLSAAEAATEGSRLNFELNLRIEWPVRTIIEMSGNKIFQLFTTVWNHARSTESKATYDLRIDIQEKSLEVQRVFDPAVTGLRKFESPHGILDFPGYTLGEHTAEQKTAELMEMILANFQITQRTFAELISMAPSSVNAMVRAKRKFNKRIVKKILFVFPCTEEFQDEIEAIPQ